jgi:nucleoside-diphosphate-sugar epimerase
MNVLITGGGGFLGAQLCKALLKRGELTGTSGKPEPVEQITLLDAAFHSPFDHPQVRCVSGDIAEREVIQSSLGAARGTSIFHLASMVSGECELRFDDALRVNLDGGRNIFEAARLQGNARLVFASSIACFGGEAMQNPNSDRTKLTPQTTYGMTKAIGELMVNDYSRRGFFDGRSVRLPTVIVRPGKPNAAASGWASGMFREPLAGVPCLLPVRRSQRHPMTGYRTAVASMIALHEVPADRFADDRAVGLPAHSVSPNDAEAVLAEISKERAGSIGAIEDAFDPRIQSIVDNWPVAVDGTRAESLGLPRPPSLKQIIEEYLEDFGSSSNPTV